MGGGGNSKVWLLYKNGILKVAREVWLIQIRAEYTVDVYTDTQTVKLGYNNNIWCDISSVASDILRYQLITHC